MDLKCITIRKKAVSKALCVQIPPHDSLESQHHRSKWPPVVGEELATKEPFLTLYVVVVT